MKTRFNRKKTRDLVAEMKKALIEQGMSKAEAEKRAEEAMRSSVVIQSPPKDIEEYRNTLSNLKKSRNRIKQLLKKARTESTRKRIEKELERLESAIKHAEEKPLKRGVSGEDVPLEEWVKNVRQKRDKILSSSVYSPEEKEFYVWYAKVVEEIAAALKKRGEKR